MIKKVRVDQLRPGIFVHDFNSGWKTNNLIINETLIKEQKIIDIITSWGIKEVYIDTDRGLDVAEARTAVEATRETDRALHRLGEAKPATTRHISLKEELVAAKSIRIEAINVVQRNMTAAQEGKPVDVAEAFQLIEKMEDSVARNKDALVLLTQIRNKDEYTLMHSISVGALVLSFCHFCKLPHSLTLNLAVGALFHDIGKTRVPLAILNKPGKLNDYEYAEIKKHAEYSSDVLRDAKGLPLEAYDMGLHHHERFDGNGYPHGLKGEEISYGAQLAAIADVYDAITSDRCYQNGIDRVEGLRKLYEWSEYHFNKELTYKFIRCIGVYPIGTCVKLESGLVGVVVGSTESLVQPVVRVFHNESKKGAVPLHDLDLSKVGDRVVSYEESRKWDLGKLKIFGDLAAVMSSSC